MLTQEQAENFKRKLIEQVEASFPEDKKQFAISQIEAMDSEELEKFLVRNKLLKKTGTGADTDHCVFCSIILGDIKSYKIAENSKAIAVLEINPLSKGHTIIIPKDHLTSEGEIPPQVSQLSKKISSLMKKRLKPQEVKIKNSNILGHEIINVIPVYGDQKDSNEKKPVSTEELLELQKMLTKRAAERKPSIKKDKIKTALKKPEEMFWLPRRIP